jgi:hypothetical protein
MSKKILGVSVGTWKQILGTTLVGLLMFFAVMHVHFADCQDCKPAVWKFWLGVGWFSWAAVLILYVFASVRQKHIDKEEYLDQVKKQQGL